MIISKDVLFVVITDYTVKPKAASQLCKMTNSDNEMDFEI